MKKFKLPVRIILLSLAGIIIAPAAVFFASAYLLPVSKDSFKAINFESYRIRDRNASLIREAVGASGERSRYCALSDISPLVIKSSIAVEDRNFYQHKGVDFFSVLRALRQNAATGKKVSGASTITMQLARILTGASRDLTGKISQIWTALRIERVFTKDQILEMYLNYIPYGSGAVGIETASEIYFDKPSSHLNLAEASLLAGIPQAPTFLNPFVNPANAEKRRQQVLKALEDNNYPDKDEIERAKNELPFVSKKQHKIISGHFTDYVLSFDPAPGDIITTLDGGLNELIQNMVTLHVEQYREKGLTNAAVIMLDNATGGIRALVGSRCWDDPEEGAVNGALARRQPGSALKPFAYELALESGVTPQTVLADIETEYYGTDKTLFIPQNYSQTYHGPVIFQDALVYSLNVPAIRLISEKVGVDPFLNRLKSLGFSGLNRNKDYYGLGLVLGNGEVSALELAGAYSTLARTGLYIEPSPFPSKEKIVTKRIMDEKSAALINAILRDETLRIQAFGAMNPLVFSMPIAVKTGTSNQWRDTWAVGYTKDFTLAVWAGNFNADPMDGLSGAMGAGVLFGKIIKVLAEKEPGAFGLTPEPPGLKKIALCSWSGQLPREYCPKISAVYTYDDSINLICGVHKKVIVDKYTGKILTENAPADRKKEIITAYLPAEYDQWLEENGYLKPVKTASDQGDFKIKKPREGDRYIIEPGYDIKTQTIEFQATVEERPDEVSWFLDGQKIAVKTWPYSHNWTLVKGKHILHARYGNKKSNDIHFEVR